MTITELAPRTDQQETPAPKRFREKLGQRARRIGAMLLPAETKTARYQERELPAGSPGARLAGRLDQVTQDFENRLRAYGFKPQQTNTATNPGVTTGRKEVTIQRQTSVQLNRRGIHDYDSSADIQAHAFAPNPLMTGTDIRQYEMTRTTKRDEAGKLQDVMQLSVTSGPTLERRADGARDTGYFKDFTHIDQFTLTADDAGQFGAPEHTAFSRQFQYGGFYDAKIPQEPEQVPGERFDAMMAAVEAIDLTQPGDGTFDSTAHYIPEALIAYRNGLHQRHFK